MRYLIAVAFLVLACAPLNADAGIAKPMNVTLTAAERANAEKRMPSDTVDTFMGQKMVGDGQADRTETPRWGEDLAQAVVDAGSTLPAELKAKADAKAALRATKPEGAE